MLTCVTGIVLVRYSYPHRAAPSSTAALRVLVRDEYRVVATGPADPHDSSWPSIPANVLTCQVHTDMRNTVGSDDNESKPRSWATKARNLFLRFRWSVRRTCLAGRIRDGIVVRVRRRDASDTALRALLVREEQKTVREVRILLVDWPAVAHSGNGSAREGVPRDSRGRRGAVEPRSRRGVHPFILQVPGERTSRLGLVQRC